MRVLVLGSGGREHALFQKLSDSQNIEEIYFAPGNGGVDQEFTLACDILDFAQVKSLVDQHAIDLLVVGPEAPLAEGIKDYFAKEKPKLLVFGPNKHGAQLEASKVFANDFMVKYGIPTAKSGAAKSLAEAEKLVANFSTPVVVKADGLAAGKGVSIHETKEEALERLGQIFNDKLFGTAGSQVLLQEFMTGTEASLFAICNGKEAIYLPTARDFKAAYDGGKGPNTGGMGSFCPGDILTTEHINFIDEKITRAILKEFAYTGIIYIGLMVHSQKADDLSVVEFNCRLGDPETQSVLPMLENDLLPYLVWGSGGEISEDSVLKVKQHNYFHLPQKVGATLNVVLAAKGYPAAYDKGIELHLPNEYPQDIHVIHAGTKQSQGLKSNGGRIMNVVASANSIEEAKTKAYSFIDLLKTLNDFSKLHYRLDIGV